MQFKIDKTVVLVAATKALKEGNLSHWGECEVVQCIFDTLSHSKASFIQSVTLDDYEYQTLLPFMEEV